MEDKKFIIIGDCNGDIKRNKYQNDIKLKQFINNQECKSIENINVQIDFTYYKANIKSKIDHIIVDKNYQGIILEIEHNELNTSDHLALVVKVPIRKERIEKGKKEESVKVWNINWQNDKSVEKYEEILNIKLQNVRFNNIMIENENIKEKIDIYYNQLTKAFVNSHNEVIDMMYKIKRKKNDWWTKEMTKLKDELKLARSKLKLWKDEDSKKEMKEAEKKFRKEQRRCVFVFEEARNKNIENLFNKPS